MISHKGPRLILFTCMLFTSSCVRPAPEMSIDPTATQVQIQNQLPTTTRSQATPSFFLLPTRVPGSPILTPTPDSFLLPAETKAGPESYIVQGGDTLGAIATRYHSSVEAIMLANGLSDANTLSAGQVLIIPHATPLAIQSSFKIIPDSELVYGPWSATLDVRQFIKDRGGYLASYTENIDGEYLQGADIIVRVAQDYSVNPRLLLAAIEYRSGWVTNPIPVDAGLNEPLGHIDEWHYGLYLQLSWAADELNRGYYLWKNDAIIEWILKDGSVVPANTGINAGTAGVQALFAGLDDAATWQEDVSEAGVYGSFINLFGYPFDLAIEPIVPMALIQPAMQLPFEKGVAWAFTGGPHGGWDTGSAWAALDFAPSGTEGCVVRGEWVTAVSDGLIVRADHGYVVQDLDGDGYEQSGWTVSYLHIENRERVMPGTYLFAGERIGHPSCEGGVAYATHLHLARRFNGEWIAADGPVPFNLDGWVSSGTGVEYDGYLRQAGQQVEAYDGTLSINQIQR